MQKPIATPRLSATILLIRDHPELQVFMAKRHYAMDFASGALVFPGGKASDDDAEPGWAERLDGDAGELTTAAIAAVRETYEESGLLLCRREEARGAGTPLAGPEAVDALAPYREAVDRGELSFLGLCARHGLVLALDRLVYFAHWITPEFMPKRFDTHFFLARAPAGQIAAHDGRETTESEWLAPAEALRREAAGQATILFPTRLNLDLLAGTASVAEAFDHARTRSVTTVMPVIAEDEAGQKVLTIPEDAGYGAVTEPLRRARERAGA